MSLKKRASKSIALALVGLIVATPVLNSVSAMEKTIPLNNISTIEKDIDSRSLSTMMDELKDNDEDVVISEIESEGYKSEFNKNTGIVTHTYFNKDGSIKDSYEVNFYENLNKIIEKEEQLENNQSEYAASLPHFRTSGPDFFQLKVTAIQEGGKNVHKCDIWNYNNSYKREIRSTYTASPSIMAFKTSIENVNTNWNRIVSLVGGTAAAAVIAYFGFTQTVTVAVVLSALKLLGFAYLADKVDTLMIRINDYTRSCRTGQDKFNAA